MSLRLSEHWIWDFWFAQDGDQVHVFFLHAPRALGDPELRHHNARIGHAVSQDLINWEVLPAPLPAGEPGEFDDLATWTGSVFASEGRWYLFYTGISASEQGAVQRIGLATSEDLTHWHKHGPVLEADPRWYEKLGPGAEKEAWRDPWVSYDEQTRLFRMLVTARANHGPADGRGVIGHATSSDLQTWQAGPPLSEPGEFSQLEVPQLVHIGGSWRILFCAHMDDHSARRRARPGVTPEGGTHYLVSDRPFGHYTLDRDDFLVGSPRAEYYAGRLLSHHERWYFFAWRQFDGRGQFAGELSDPMPIVVHADGSLSVQAPSTI